MNCHQICIVSLLKKTKKTNKKQKKKHTHTNYSLETILKFSGPKVITGGKWS